MSKFYKVFFTLAMLCIVNIGAFAKTLDKLNAFSSEIARDKDGNVQKYTVPVPDANIASSKYQVRTVERVDSKFIQKGVIHVKTKNLAGIDAGRSLIGTNYLNTALSRINVNQVKSFVPYEMAANDALIRETGLDRIIEIRYNSDEDPYNLCAELMNNPDVEFASPVYIRYTNDFTPNDAFINQQYALSAMNMYKAWDISKGSDTIKIAIVDSGEDINHQDLVGNVAKNTKEIAGNGIDDDKNGKIDDVNGWDFCATTNINDFNSGNYGEDNNPVNTVNTHGTSVAGCAAAVTNNNFGVASTGFNCKFIPIKCGSSISEAKGIYRGYEGITYAANLGAHIINCSWGGSGYSPSEESVINYAYNKGACLIISSGNDAANTDDVNFYPGSFQNVISIGSIDQSVEPSSFSNYGYTVGVFAPGSAIYTTDANNKYTTIDGTSFSSPYVAGIAGLIKSVHPDWSPKKIYHQLRSTSNTNLQISTESELYYGYVDAYKALAYNSTDPTKQIPGISALSTEFTDGISANLTDLSQRPYKMVIKNYLGDAKNLKITVTAIDRGLTISNNIFDISELKTDSTVTINPTLQLTDANPWYSGFIKVLVYYEAGDYRDYELIKVPVEYAVNKNVYTLTEQLPISYLPYLYSAYAPSSEVCWYTGYGSGLFDYAGGYIIQSKSGLSYERLSYSPMTSVYAFDASKAYMTSSSSYERKVYKTEDGGNNWTSVDIASLTSFCNNIHFFDDNNGMIVGDPQNSKWGVLKTNDGGANWSQITNIPAPNTNESGLNTSVFWLENKGWFGTSGGRVFYTANQGGQWKAASITGALNVHFIAFVNADSGMAIFDKQINGLKYVAYTTNGGTSWTATNINFRDLGFDVVNTFNLYDNKSFYFLLTDGGIVSTADFGTTWKSVKTKRYGPTTAGAAYSYYPNYAVVFNGGLNFGKLSFKYTVANGTRELVALDGTDFIIDTTEVNKSKSKAFKIKNIGSVDTDISDITVEPGENTSAGEFSLMTTNPGLIETMASLSIRVKFAPMTTGKKSATIVIKSNAIQPEMRINFTAYAKEAAPVNSIIFTDGDTLIIDTTEIYANRSSIIQVKNTGTKQIDISGVEIVAGDNTAASEFTYSQDFNKNLSVGASTNIELTFTPKTIGDKNATLKIYNNGDISPILLTLKSFAKNALNVEDLMINKAIISPNPVADMLYVKFDSEYIPNKVQIIDVEGNTVYNSDLDNETITDMVIDTKNFANGSYIIKIQYADNRVEKRNIVIIK